MVVCTGTATVCVITWMVAAQHANVVLLNCNMTFDLKWQNQNAAVYNQLIFPTSSSSCRMLMSSVSVSRFIKNRKWDKPKAGFWLPLIRVQPFKMSLPCLLDPHDAAVAPFTRQGRIWSLKKPNQFTTHTCTLACFVSVSVNVWVIRKPFSVA